MAEKFKKLRSAGEWGGYLADLLTILTANWQVAVAAIIAIASGAIGWLRDFALLPQVLSPLLFFFSSCGP
jgi:hypothetical protein